MKAIEQGWPSQSTILDVMAWQYPVPGGWICPKCIYHRGGVICAKNVFISCVGANLSGCRFFIEGCRHCGRSD